mmetsp:Transcript_53487/g.116195  ORF Transcript_53487/g.116195 Transcript_53487/m.116195 type:complete len:200 (+) Transcript_53487:2249-2848(+)
MISPGGVSPAPAGRRAVWSRHRARSVSAGGGGGAVSVGTSRSTRSLQVSSAARCLPRSARVNSPWAIEPMSHCNRRTDSLRGTLRRHCLASTEVMTVSRDSALATSHAVTERRSQGKASCGVSSASVVGAPNAAAAVARADAVSIAAEMAAMLEVCPGGGAPGSDAVAVSTIREKTCGTRRRRIVCPRAMPRMRHAPWA